MGKRAILMKFLSLQRVICQCRLMGESRRKEERTHALRCLASIVKESRFGNGTTNCRFTPLNTDDKRGTAARLFETPQLVRLLTFNGKITKNSTISKRNVCMHQKEYRTRLSTTTAEHFCQSRHRRPDNEGNPTVRRQPVSRSPLQSESATTSFCTAQTQYLRKRLRSSVSM